MKKVAFCLCPPKFFFLLCFFFSAFYTKSLSATYTSITGTGNWSSNTSWSCPGGCPSAYPKTGDVVIIRGSITLDAAAVIGGTLAGTTIQSGGTLTLATNLSSNISLTGGSLATSSTNPITLTGTVTSTGGGSITPLVAAPLTLTGGITLSNSSGTLNYSGGNLTAPSLTINSGSTLNIGTSAANSGKLTLKGNATMLGKLVVNKGGTMDASGYTLSIDAGVTGNTACNQANANVQIDGIVLVDNLIMEESCMYVSGVNSISTSTPPGFVKVQKNLTLNQKGKMEIAGLYLVGGNVDADQGNIAITGTGYYGVSGTTDYANNALNSSLNYCENSSILSCPSNSTCPFINTQNTTNECNNVCRAYVCSGFYASFPLPIDLLSFSAKVESAAKRVRLEWVTASETNNDYFAVERSSNGVDFEEIYREKGASTSAAIRTYSTYDMHPLPGISYYRLKQVDIDEKFTYSKLVSIAYQQADFTISPNPTDGKAIDITWNPEVKEAVISIYNQLGYELYTRKMFHTDSGQMITLPESLQQGVYLVKIYTSGRIFTEKLIVYK